VFEQIRVTFQHLFIVAAVLTMVSCSLYQPLKDHDLYRGPMRAPPESGVRVTYFGNTTILLCDGETALLVDGFLSRPNAWRVAFGKVRPDPAIIARQLELGRVGRVTALLVGHSHYDHALDAPIVARQTGALAVGSRSYAYVHKGGGGQMDAAHLEVVSPAGLQRHFGKFTVRFRLSEHVPPHLPRQDQMEGQIIAPVRAPAPATAYKRGDVFVLHIEHPHGTIAITTTAGAREGQFDDLRADVVMLGVGLLAKEPRERQEIYWRETVEKLNPRTVIPVHWDTFTAKLDPNPVPKTNLRAPRLKFLDDTRAAMTFVKEHAAGRAVWVMGLRDSFVLSNGAVLRSWQ
jgi:L-ascorbate metabolism protein UlaG (beta-lactamase superfamily)